MKLLKKGSQGPDVEFLQERLTANGFHTAADGQFGPKTLQAVEQFQASSGIAADGIVGPQTWNLLLVESRVVNPYSGGAIPDLEALGKAALEGATKRAARSAVLWCAINDIGLVEQPNGSNGGPQIRHLTHWWSDADLKVPEEDREAPQSYWDYVRVNDEKLPPWCAIAVSSWLRIGLQLQAKPWADHPFGTWLGGVAQLEEWGREKECSEPVWPLVRATGDSRVFAYAEAGAIFTMGRGGSGSDPTTSIRNGHTGLVIADDGDRIYTCEANVGNAVGWKHRKKSDLRMFISWWEAL